MDYVLKHTDLSKMKKLAIVKTMPISNILKYILDDGSRIAARPSGTEPKIKIDYCVKGITRKNAEDNFCCIQKMVTKHLKLRFPLS